MMFSSNTCRFVICFLSLSLSATAETLRAVQRELVEPAQEPVDLGTAGDYAILAKTGITNVKGSVVTGNIGVSPINAAAITGFDLIMDATGVFSKSAEVTGRAFASTYISPTPDGLSTAVLAMEKAYNDAAGRPESIDGNRVNFHGGLLDEVILTPGVYTFSKYVTIVGDITFDAGGDEDAVFIIQIANYLTLAANKKVILAGGAKAENIFWQVAGAVNVGAGAHMEGILLVKTAATFVTGSSLNGRILTQTFCTLQKNIITEPPTAV
jgi:hypothetical protein